MLTNLFQGLREHAIATSGLETANKLIPFDSLSCLRSIEENISFNESLDRTWTAYFCKVLEFPDPYREFATKKNCTPGKSYACKSTCIAINRNCLNPLPAQAQNYAAFLAMTTSGSTPTNSAPSTPAVTTTPSATSAAKKPRTSKKTAAAVPTPTNSAPSAPAATTIPSATPSTSPSPSSPIKTNDKELNDKRNYLVKQFGQKTVDASEQNVQKIFNDPDTNVHIRIGSTATLEFILGSRFKTAHELGRKDHDIPFLQDNYLKARSRVEDKTLGYDKNTPDSDRPIYGYLGGKDLSGASHKDVAQGYGSITVRLKPEVKDRSTFTGADSFKSGIASEVNNDGTPPPPNAASLVSSTRHGYDKDKLPSGYPKAYADKTGDGRQLVAASKAKTIDDLTPALSPTGNRYIEAQIHGKVEPKDIAEIHFEPKGVGDRPSVAVAKFAKDNGVDLYNNGKKLSSQDLDNLISPPTPPVSKKVNDVQKLSDAIDAGDFHTVLDLAADIDKKAAALKVTPANRHDPKMAYLASQNGFADKPKVVQPQDLDATWQQGGHLLIRGVPKGFVKPFIKDEYYVGGDGGAMYGMGQYAWHCGKVKQGQTVPPPPVGYDPKSTSKDAKDAFNTGDKLGYITPSNETIRMALPKDAKVTTQTSMVNEMKDLDNKIDAWAAQEKQKILATSGNVGTIGLDARGLAIKSDDANKFKKALKLMPGGEIQLQPKKAGGKIETLPNEYTIQPGSFSVLTTPLGTYRFNGKSTPAPLRQAYSDYVAMRAATQEAEEQLSDTHHVKNMSASGGTYKIPTKSSGGKDIDTGLSIKSNSKGFFASDGKHWDSETFTNKADAEKALLQKHLQPNAIKLIRNGGSTSTNPAIADFDQKVKRMKNTLYGDSSNVTTPSGRYAVIKGYDGVMADDSYEPDRMFVVYNRGKVLVQPNSLDYNQGKKTGAA